MKKDKILAMAVARESGKKRQISCILLAGGKNTRMGNNKALLRIGSHAVIREQINILGQIFKKIVLVAKKSDEFENFPVRIVEDILPGLGPLGGLYTGLVYSPYEYNFLIGCDMPFVNTNLIRYMISLAETADIIVPVFNHRVETLFAIYSRQCLEAVVKQISAGHFKLADILNSHRVNYLDQKQIKRFDPEGHSFFNMNTPRDYQRAKKIRQKELA